jgi:hypothetical protein
MKYVTAQDFGADLTDSRLQADIYSEIFRGTALSF